MSFHCSKVEKENEMYVMEKGRKEKFQQPFNSKEVVQMMIGF